MNEKSYAEAKEEIDSSLFLMNFFLKCLGVSFDNRPKSFLLDLRYKIVFATVMATIYFHTLSDVLYMTFLIMEHPKVEVLVRYFHMFGYGYLCLTRLYILWSKRVVFGELLTELVVIWPTSPLPPEAAFMKINKLKGLRTRQIWYTGLTFATVLFFSATPLAVAGYRWVRGEEPELGLIWAMWYPFDTSEPVTHGFVYMFEIFVGLVCATITIASDLWFTSMANHIGILLRVLHMRLRTLGKDESSHHDSSQLIVDSIKFHQRLIRYCNSLEDAFTSFNFNNVLLCSINTCCATFVILLIEPIFVLGNKLFLAAYLVQTFVVCWYADDIYYANAEVALAAYESEWYNLDVRSRKLLLTLIHRAQKPLGFTAMKFTTITLQTFYTIMSRSYSYFAVLHTMYKTDESN